MKYRLALCLAPVFLAGSSVAQQPPPVQLTAHIPLMKVDGRMDHMTVDLDGQRLFATAFDNHTLEIIDVRAGRQVSTITSLNQPQGAYYEPAGKHLFVASGGDGTLKMFDGGSLQLLKTVKLGEDADNVRYDAARNHVLVGYGGEKFLYGKAERQQGDGALAVLDASGNLIGRIPTDAHPESFQLEKGGTRVFINVPDKMEIQVADLANDRTIAHWPSSGCSDNFPMSIDEPGHRLFVACRMPATLMAFDTETGKPVASIALDPKIFSDDIFFDAARRRIYVIGRTAGADERAPAPGFLEVIRQLDPNRYEKIGTYPTGWGAQTGFFTPELSKLFVATRRQQGGPGGEILVFEPK